MKKTILTLAVLFSCIIASAQITTISQTEINKLRYFAETGSYTLEMRDELSGGEIRIFMLTKQYMTGFLDIMSGILSGKYPDGIAINNGTGNVVTIYKDEKNRVLLLENNGVYGSIDPATISKFKEAIKAQK